MKIYFDIMKKGDIMKIYTKFFWRKLFLIIDLLPFAKLLKLSAINHSSSEKSIIFVP